MAHRTLLGMLTPSSNTVLEPVTAAMLAGLPEASAHFARLRVTAIALSAGSLAQFDTGAFMPAAELLADAKVGAIGWNGTSSSWLGFETDERLCAAIRARTGIPATSSVLALNEILARTGVRRLGLVTPYRADVQARIVTNYAALGIGCAAERHSGIEDNFSFSEVTEADIAGMIRAVAAEKPDAIAIVCTNLRAAPLAAALEAELGIPVHDSVATVVWKCLALAGADPARVRGWGGLFSLRAG